ncbi:hypothetical protein GOP47_0019547 [Adiantum capillus-veneris]|uniref:Uncharacterized protein n=1 Tax=Adiantum capillus-veneris TaxID=13818 RepID=A0A9D4Z8Q5_ADICA|nr:hypothetical protein GOP47_0019547 [Adiantum capillus-veneris]
MGRRASGESFERGDMLTSHQHKLCHEQYLEWRLGHGWCRRRATWLAMSGGFGLDALCVGHARPLTRGRSMVGESTRDNFHCGKFQRGGLH